MQKGNVLFMILIAVALFAALSYGVTRAGGGGGATASREQAALAAAQLISYAGQVEQAVSRLMLAGGCTGANDTGNTLDFRSTRWAVPARYQNPNGTADCEVFSSTGGGVAWQPVPVAARDPASAEIAVNNKDRVGNVGTDTTLKASVDLMLLAYVNREACMAINKLAGVSNNGTTTGTGLGPPELGTGSGFPTAIPLSAARSFIGDYDDPNPSTLFGHDANAAAPLWGKRTGCYWNPAATAQHFYFYHVIIAR